VIAAGLVTMLCAMNVAAVDRNWNEPLGGAFNNGANWTPMGVPIPGDQAFFSLPDIFTVTFPASSANTSTFVTDGEVTMLTTAVVQTYTVTNDLVITNATLTVADLVVFVADETNVNDNSLLNMGPNGTLRFNKLNISNTAAGPATVECIGPSMELESFNSSFSKIAVGAFGGNGTLRVGDFGIATMVGSTAVCDTSVANTVGLISLESSASMVTRNLLVNAIGGANQSGTINIDGGAVLTVSHMLNVGNAAELGVGQINVMTGGTLDLGVVSNTIGGSGTLALFDGTLNLDMPLVVDGGQFTADATSTIAHANNIALTVRNKGLIDWGQSINLSASNSKSPSIINVQSGGLFESALSCTIAGVFDSAGRINVDGVAGDGTRSELRGEGLGPDADLFIGVGGVGELNVTNGGLVMFRDDGLWGTDATGVAVVTVSGTDADNARSEIDLVNGGPNAELILGDAGNVNIDVLGGGRIAVGGDVRVAIQPGSVAAVDIVGSNGSLFVSTLSAGDDLYVGGNDVLAGGTATINVDAARLETHDFVRLWPGATVTLSNDAFMSGNTLDNRGLLRGDATLEVLTVSNSNLLEPGDDTAAGSLDIFGALFQTSTGTLEIDLFGENPGEFDTIIAGTNISLEGALVISMPTGYTPASGTTFDIIEFGGTNAVNFSSVTVPEPYSATLDVVGSVVRLGLTMPIIIVPCPWDCVPDNGDGTFGNDLVNVDDLLAVINSFGPVVDDPCDNTPDNGDGTFGNGIVNIDDLLEVINNFGVCPE
jgi:hypothetical protein